MGHRWLLCVAAVLLAGACGQPSDGSGIAAPGLAPVDAGPRVSSDGGSSRQATVGDDGLAERFGLAENAASPTIEVIDTAASVHIQTHRLPADRLSPVGPGTGCDLPLISSIGRHQSADQLVVVRSLDWSSTTALVDVATRHGAEWVCQRGAQTAMLGRTGTRPLAERRSGDGTTPAGAFPLGVATAWDGQVFSFFGNSPDPGVRGNYRAVQTGDCWGATPNTAAYNHLVRRTICPGPDDEYLPRFTQAYGHAALIGANAEPNVSGDAPGETPFAAAIFLHRTVHQTSGQPKPTSGCVSLELEDLVTTLLLLDPLLEPTFVIGPASWLREINA